MVGSDYLLVGVLDYLHERDIKAPRDVSIVSADNFIQTFSFQGLILLFSRGFGKATGLILAGVVNMEV